MLERLSPTMQAVPDPFTLSWEFVGRANVPGLGNLVVFVSSYLVLSCLLRSCNSNRTGTIKPGN